MWACERTGRTTGESNRARPLSECRCKPNSASLGLRSVSTAANPERYIPRLKLSSIGNSFLRTLQRQIQPLDGYPLQKQYSLSPNFANLPILPPWTHPFVSVSSWYWLVSWCATNLRLTCSYPSCARWIPRPQENDRKACKPRQSWQPVLLQINPPYRSSCSQFVFSLVLDMCWLELRKGTVPPFFLGNFCDFGASTLHLLQNLSLYALCRTPYLPPISCPLRAGRIYWIVARYKTHQWTSVSSCHCETVEDRCEIRTFSPLPYCRISLSFIILLSQNT